MSNIDIWSSRIANFSQIGVLALAAFGYFYTVLPVYQKSLLDEEIAKKTLELEKKDKKINEINQMLANRSSELKKLTEDAEKAKADAYSAKNSLKTMQGKYTKQYSELRVHLLSQFISLAFSGCKKEEWNSMKLKKCLYNAAESEVLKELNQNDRSKLKRNINAQIPKMVIAYNKFNATFNGDIGIIEEKTKKIKNDCENDRTIKSNEDKIKQIELEHECKSQLIQLDVEKYKIEINRAFGIEDLMSNSLNTIATKTEN
ncbi:hypothetical protein ACWXWL_11395 [Pantoea ananatis]